jgi:hypothetical protein
MTVQRSFHFGGVDVLATAHDHVLLPVDEVDVVSLINHRQVAGVQPTISKPVSCLLGLVPITPHDVRPASDNLADLAWRHLLSTLIHDAHVHSDVGLAGAGEPTLPDGAGLCDPASMVLRGEACDRWRGLGHPRLLE